MFERILVPLDGSKLSEQALPYAEELARACHSEVTLIYICEEADTRYCHEQQVYLERMAKTVADTIEGDAKASVKPVVVDGHPAAAVIDHATKNNISLIIMATHGRSGVMLWAMGSTADKILHGTDMPILLVRANVPAPDTGRSGQMFDRILVPLDGSAAAEAVLPYVRSIVEKLESEVILLQVVARGQHVHTVGGLDYIAFTEQQVESAKADAQRYLEGVSRRFTGTKAKVRSELRFGDPAEEVIKLAGETKARLVAMSSHGHSGPDRWAFGGITAKVLHNGRTSLLVVRTPAKRE